MIKKNFNTLIFGFLSVIIFSCYSSQVSRKTDSRTSETLSKDILNDNNLTENLINEDIYPIFSNINSGDTIILNKRIYSLSKKIYLIDKKNILILGNGSEVIMNDSMEVSIKGGMIQLTRCDNITIKDITLNANRDARKCVEEPAHTFGIYQSKNVFLEKVKTINNVVDGFFIATFHPQNFETYPKDINLIDCDALNSFRNGLSIINAFDVTIDGGSYSNSNGTRPEAGIDIESDYDNIVHANRNIKIKNVTIKNNRGLGILVSQKGTPKNIEISNSTIHNNEGGIKITSIKTSVLNCDLKDNDKFGIESVRYDYRARDYNKIIGNQISGSKIGISYLGYGGIIDNNFIQDSENTAILLNGNTKNKTHVLLKNNIIRGTITYGIYIQNFGTSILDSNIVESNSLNSIYLQNSISEIKNSNLKNSEVGIELVGSEVKLDKTTFNKLNVGIKIRGGGKYNPKLNENSSTYINTTVKKVNLN